MCNRYVIVSTVSIFNSVIFLKSKFSILYDAVYQLVLLVFGAQRQAERGMMVM